MIEIEQQAGYGKAKAKEGMLENFFVTVGELRLKKESHHGVYARREWSGSLSLIGSK